MKKLILSLIFVIALITPSYGQIINSGSSSQHMSSDFFSNQILVGTQARDLNACYMGNNIYVITYTDFYLYGTNQGTYVHAVAVKLENGKLTKQGNKIFLQQNTSAQLYNGTNTEMSKSLCITSITSTLFIVSYYLSNNGGVDLVAASIDPATLNITINNRFTDSTETGAPGSSRIFRVADDKVAYFLISGNNSYLKGKLFSLTGTNISSKIWDSNLITDKQYSSGSRYLTLEKLNDNEWSGLVGADASSYSSWVTIKESGGSLSCAYQHNNSTSGYRYSIANFPNRRLSFTLYPYYSNIFVNEMVTTNAPSIPYYQLFNSGTYIYNSSNYNNFESARHNMLDIIW